MESKSLQVIHNGETELPELILTLRKKLQETELDYLQNMRTDDEFLIKFLRPKKYNVERAYESILGSFKCINNYFLDIISDPNTTSAYVVPVFDAKILQRLNTKACQAGSVTIMINVRCWDTNEFTLRELQQAAVIFAEYLFEQLESQLNGCSIIVDLQGLSLNQVRQLTLAEIKRNVYAANAVQAGSSISIIGIHFINCPRIFWGLFNIIKMFLKEKMRKRIVFHPNLESLYEYFNKEHLPMSLGGPLKDNDLTEHNEMVEKFMTKNFHCKECIMSTDFKNNPEQ